MSKSATALPSHAPQDIGYLRPLVGLKLTSSAEVASYGLPTHYFTVRKVPGVPGAGYRTVLSDAGFRYLFLEQEYTVAKVLELYPAINRNLLVLSKKMYREEYKEELRRLRSKHHAIAVTGNRRGELKISTCLLDETALREALEKGTPVPAIGRSMGVSKKVVLANMAHYGLRQTHITPPRLLHADAIHMEQLEVFSPGIGEKAKNFYQDQAGFFSALYDAHCAIQKLVWFVKAQGRWHGSTKERGYVPKSRISWSTNKYELKLSMSLTELGVEHDREHILYGNSRVDFAFPGTDLLVEIDGEYHVSNEKTREQDKRKEAAASSMGLQIHRVTTKDVEQDLDLVAADIATYVKWYLSSQQECRTSGT